MFYDYRHKGQAFGPIVMGACRALVYCAAAAGALGVVPVPVAIAAVRDVGLHRHADVDREDAGLGHLVPWLLAGICLVDAVMIALAGEPGWR